MSRRFGTQSQIALWNLVQLANAIHPLVEVGPALQTALDVYPKTFNKEWPEMMASKLGFDSSRLKTKARLGYLPLVRSLGMTTNL